MVIRKQHITKHVIFTENLSVPLEQKMHIREIQILKQKIFPMSLPQSKDQRDLKLEKSPSYQLVARPMLVTQYKMGVMTLRTRDVHALCES